MVKNDVSDETESDDGEKVDLDGSMNSLRGRAALGSVMAAC